MDKMVSLLISVGIITFGAWVAAPQSPKVALGLDHEARFHSLTEPSASMTIGNLWRLCGSNQAPKG